MSNEKQFTMTEIQNEVLVTEAVPTVFGPFPRPVHTMGPSNEETIYMSTPDQGRFYRTGTITLAPEKAFEIAAQVSLLDKVGLNAIFLGAEITNVGIARVKGKLYWWNTRAGVAELMMDRGAGQPAGLAFSATWEAQTGQILPALSGIAIPAPDVHIRVWKGLDFQVEIAALAAIWLKVWGMRMA